MALWKAGVQYEDDVVSGQKWKILKASGALPYGQIPILTFEDGTMLGQTGTLINYVGSRYNMMPHDLEVKALAESFSTYTMEDVQAKVGPACFFDNEEKTKTKIAIEKLSEWCGKLDK